MTARGQPRPRWEISDVLDRTDLPALLDELSQPATHSFRSRRWHCPMPDHDDHNPSVTVHTDHRGHERWRCWSGDHTHRGDAIDLVTATQSLSKADAIDWLANRAGMVPDQPLPPVRRKPRPAAPRFAPLDPAVVRYAQACERVLWTNGGREVRDWLHDRGFSDELLRANHVGADPGRNLMPRRRGLPHGTGPAAVLPALDQQGTIQYLQARYLEPGPEKYDNPAGALGSNPRLAWTRTPDTTTRPGVLTVCEGIPDALTAAGAGFAAVAILGNQAPDQRVARQLANHANDNHQQIIAVVDADPAGRASAQHLSDLLDTHQQVLTAIEPAIGSDLNEWALRDPAWWQSEQVAAAVGPARTPGIRPADSLGVAG